MKNVKIVFIVILLMNIGLLVGASFVLDIGSDFQIWLTLILWSIGSILGVIRFHRLVRAQSKRILIHKFGLVILYLFTLVPVSLVCFFVFLSIALKGVDFK